MRRRQVEVAVTDVCSTKPRIVVSWPQMEGAGELASSCGKVSGSCKHAEVAAADVRGIGPPPCVIAVDEGRQGAGRQLG